MRLGQPDDGNQPESRTQRVAYDQLTEAFGPGSNGPFLLAVDTPKGAPETEQQLARAPAGGRRHARHRRACPPAALSEDGEMATIFAIPDHRAAGRQRPPTCSTACATTSSRRAIAGTPLKVYVGGNTAGFEDVSDKVAARLPVFISLVIGLSVLLLMMAFRSLWIPLVSARLQPAVGRAPPTASSWPSSRRASARA